MIKENQKQFTAKCRYCYEASEGIYWIYYIKKVNKNSLRVIIQSVVNCKLKKVFPTNRIDSFPVSKFTSQGFEQIAFGGNCFMQNKFTSENTLEHMYYTNEDFRETIEDFVKSNNK